MDLLGHSGIRGRRTARYRNGGDHARITSWAASHRPTHSLGYELPRSEFPRFTLTVCYADRMHIGIRLAIVVRAAVACAVLISSVACGGDDSSPTSPSVNVPFSQTDLRVGTGTEATTGRRLTVNYSGWLYSTSAAENKGRQFDSGAFPFTLGAGEVIRGFDQGVAGMRVGGLRRIVIPPDLGFGSQGNGTAIPPNATLIFEVELTAVN
jgi:FKBP-type peptidyl-prolyl cis-trans isomerase FkpA